MSNAIQLDLFGEPIQQDKPKKRKPNPDSEIIIAIVSLFGTTEDMMLTETLSTDEADKLIMLAKRYGTSNLIRRLINSL